MASFFSNYLKDKLNDHLHGGPAYTTPGTTYLAIMTAAPTGIGGGTEGSATGYSRLAVTNDATHWPASSSQIKSNGVRLDWGTISGTLGTAVGIAEYDAASGGNLLTYADLTTPRAISASPFYIDVGGLSFGYTEC